MLSSQYNQPIHKRCFTLSAPTQQNQAFDIQVIVIMKSLVCLAVFIHMSSGLFFGSTRTPVMLRECHTKILFTLLDFNVIILYGNIIHYPFSHFRYLLATEIPNAHHSVVLNVLELNSSSVLDQTIYCIRKMCAKIKFSL